MKRTAEIVLAVIGALGYVFTAALGGFMIWLQNNKGLMEEVFNETIEQNPELGMSDMEVMLDALGTGGWLFAIASVVAVILGIVAIVFLKSNKKPVVAGIIFIATAVIVAIVTSGAGILAGLFYLIAGVMALVRKPKQVIEE
ncbi:MULTISPECIES: DUF4064 domain-containing protein [Planococcus]|uniref:DUF4064 domain-containing protein n=1 Tax=Planococcus faecalis TaxID=1598147 RepID=A0ABN4XSM3_9BACL|nr:MULTISPECIES: DUF4064 domain-containing protein [Planococcus]AQU80710.1 hypothetical protein AJGP001_16070 [Planococcus faecalis]MDJ0331915.1 DUF4064 domain-containing protein [Planococcus sp. S3-L1]OHX55703.1 hypothetical protein BB777_00640 [Planococcus faecalis]